MPQKYSKNFAKTKETENIFVATFGYIYENAYLCCLKLGYKKPL
jgi:hypothetical protein